MARNGRTQNIVELQFQAHDKEMLEILCREYWLKPQTNNI